MKTIETAYICDEGYILATLISIRSLKKNKAEDVCYVVHIILVGVEVGKEAEQIFRDEEVDHKFCIQIHRSNVQTDGIFFSHSYVSKAALVKFQLPRILENVKQVLYLDGDTLIRPGLEEICRTDIRNDYAAVVKDMSAYSGGHMQELGLSNYFNSGVMYLNLEQMRKDDTEQALIHCKKNEKQHLFMDQDAFNIVFRNKVVYIHPKYNLIYDIFRKYTCSEIASFYETAEAEIASIDKTAAVLHMAGARKPWKEQESEQLAEWLSYIQSFAEFAVCEKAYYNKLLSLEAALQKEAFQRESGQGRLEQKNLQMIEQMNTRSNQIQLEMQNKIVELDKRYLDASKELLKKNTELETRIAVCENTFTRRIWRWLLRWKKSL